MSGTLGSSYWPVFLQFKIYVAYLGKRLNWCIYPPFLVKIGLKDPQNHANGYFFNIYTYMVMTPAAGYFRNYQTFMVHRK